MWGIAMSLTLILPTFALWSSFLAFNNTTTLVCVVRCSYLPRVSPALEVLACSLVQCRPSPYDRGFWGNTEELLGKRKVLWCLPIIPPSATSASVNASEALLESDSPV